MKINIDWTVSEAYKIFDRAENDGQRMAALNFIASLLKVGEKCADGVEVAEVLIAPAFRS